METGLKTRVPGFIEIGETIRISTETGGYHEPGLIRDCVSNQLANLQNSPGHARG